MVIDEVYRILQYAFDNKLTIKEAITKLNVNVKYSTVITYKNKYNITEYDRHKIDKKDEACFRWNTRKMAESERFSQMFHTSIGLVKPNREFVLCKVA